MAYGKPELEEGFFQLAHELDAAWELGKFTDAERLILHEIKRRIFFPAFLTWFALDIKDISKRHGCLRQFVEKGIGALVDGQLLIEGDGEHAGLYRCSKYYLRYTRTRVRADGDGPGRVPRYDAATASEIAAAAAMAKSYIDFSGGPRPRRKPVTSTPAVQPQGCEFATTQLPLATTGLQSATVQLPTGNPTVADSQPYSCNDSGPPRPPIGERGRGIENLRIGECVEADAHTPAPRPEATPTHREPADAAAFEAAVRLLMADQNAESVGLALSRNAHTAEVRALEGWRLLHAARKFTGPDIPPGKGFPYFRRIAANATLEEAAAHGKPQQQRHGRHAPRPPEPPTEYYTCRFPKPTGSTRPPRTTNGGGAA